ncbi:MAG: DNRLRE domain-containing protein [Planctomycetaceae bacterium]|nr:DNRLRE domain-containing protein [Planctomycetaceae bacterium]
MKSRVALAIGLLSVMDVSASAATITLTPNYDGFVAYNSVANWTGTTFDAGNWDSQVANRDSRAFIHFDLSGIPVGATITSATVTFYVTQKYNFGGLDLYKVNSAWTTAMAGSTIRALGVTSLGGLSPVTAGSSPSKAITSTVQSWYAGANYGLSIRGTEGFTQTGFRLASAEYSTASRRPTLVIDYLLAAITGTPSPGVLDLGSVGAGGPPLALGLAVENTLDAGSNLILSGITGLGNGFSLQGGNANATLVGDGVSGSGPDLENLMFSFDPTGLAEGNYSTDITIHSNAGDLNYTLSAIVIPEPATMVLLGLGLAGVLLRRRRTAD